MTAASNFLAFVTDPRVILWTLAVFTFGGIAGMYLEAWRLAVERKRNTWMHPEPKGWAADEDPTVNAARRVS